MDIYLEVGALVPTYLVNNLAKKEVKENEIFWSWKSLDPDPHGAKILDSGSDPKHWLKAADEVHGTVGTARLTTYGTW